MTTILTPDQENEPVTKGFLKQELDQSFESFTDKMFKTFATKDELSELREEMKEDNRKNTDKILKSNDELMAELKKNNENFTMNQAAHDRFEERITVLEEKTGISPVSV